LPKRKIYRLVENSPKSKVFFRLSENTLAWARIRHRLGENTLSLGRKIFCLGKNTLESTLAAGASRLGDFTLA